LKDKETDAQIRIITGPRSHNQQQAKQNLMGILEEKLIDWRGDDKEFGLIIVDFRGQIFT
jgi:hypothetical protein